MQRLHPVVLLVVLISLGAASAPASHGQPHSSTARVGATVHVSSTEGRLVQGVQSSDSVAVHFQTGLGERAVLLAYVVALWERVPAPGRDVRRSARRGALVSGVLLGGGSLALNVAMCEYDCDREYAVFAVAAGASVGALLGAGRRAVRGRWVRRVP